MTLIMQVNNVHIKERNTISLCSIPPSNLFSGSLLVTALCF